MIPTISKGSKDPSLAKNWFSTLLLGMHCTAQKANIPGQRTGKQAVPEDGSSFPREFATAHLTCSRYG